MPRVALRPSRFVADLLRNRRKHLGLTLRQVEERARAVGAPIPFSTLARVENGKVDPGLRRLHALLRVYGLPIEAAGDVLDLEIHAQAVPATTDPDGLRTEAVEAWRAGDSRRALSCLAAFQRAVLSGGADRASRHDGLLRFAVLASKVGKHHLSRLILDQLLVDAPESDLVPRILIQQAICWNALGSSDAAMAFLGRAEERLETAQGVQKGGESVSLAWVRHQRGCIHLDRGEFDAASSSLAEAVKAYERAGDPHGKGLALITIARLHYRQGSPAKAIGASRRARRHAERRGFERLRVLALVEEGRAHGLAANWEAGAEVLRDALAASLKSTDAVAQFHAHYQLARAHASLGRPELAEVSLNAAKYFVRFVDERSPEADEVRASLTERNG